MKEILVDHTAPGNFRTKHESLWYTLAGCALFWAGFLTLLTLCWML